MSEFLKDRWFLLLVLVVFIVCKIPHLYYPYYWDESWPYAVAIKDMYKHGISLMPSALDPELSRGHPLFFHFIAAGWMNIFGTSHLAMHSFALTISVLFLISIYEAGLRLFNQETAILCLALVATQVIFFVQSSFVLFEVLVAFLCFLSLFLYVKEKYFLTALCLTMLFYTKESGLVLGVVIGIDAFAGLFNKNNSLNTRLFRLFSVCIPCVLIMIFFLLQKQIRGWYVFPLHAGIADFSWTTFWYKFRMACVRDAFYQNFKFYYFLVLIVLSLVAAIKNKSIKYLAIFLPGIIIYYFVDDMRAGRILPSVPFFILFVLSVFYFVYIFSSSKFYSINYQRRFIVLTAVFVLCFLCFSTINFYTYRYLLAALIPLLFLTGVFCAMLIEHSFKGLYYPVLAIILGIGFFSFKYNDGYGDADLGAFDAMNVQQSVVNYFEQNNDYDKEIGCGSFLEQEHLKDPATGFLHSTKVFRNVNWEINEKTSYAVFDNIEPDARYNDIKTSPGFRLVYRNGKGKVWAEIYARR